MGREDFLRVLDKYGSSANGDASATQPQEEPSTSTAIPVRGKAEEIQKKQAQAFSPESEKTTPAGPAAAPTAIPQKGAQPIAVNNEQEQAIPARRTYQGKELAPYDISKKPLDLKSYLAEQEQWLEDQKPGFIMGSLGDIAGGAVDAAETYMRAGRALPGGPSVGGPQAGEEAGWLDNKIQGLIDWRDSTNFVQPQEHTGFSRWWHEGLRAASMSIVSKAPGAVAGALAGAASTGPLAPLGAFAGGVLGYAAQGGVIYGLSEYDSFKETAIKAGKTPGEAEQGAIISAVAEGGFEALGDLIIGFTMGASSPITVPGKAMLGNTVKEMMGLNVKETAKRVTTSAFIEAGSEMATAGVQTDQYNRIGATDQKFWEGAMDAFGPALVAGFMFGGMGTYFSHEQRKAIQERMAKATPAITPEQLARETANARRRKNGETVTDPVHPGFERAQVVSYIGQEIAKTNKDVADRWTRSAMQAVIRGEALDLSTPIEAEVVSDVDLTGQGAGVEAFNSGQYGDEIPASPWSQPFFEDDQNDTYEPAQFYGPSRNTPAALEHDLEVAKAMLEGSTDEIFSNSLKSHISYLQGEITRRAQYEGVSVEQGINREITSNFPVATQAPTAIPTRSQAVEAAAAETETDITPEQAETGGYQKGAVTLHGIGFSIETPAGAQRSGIDPDTGEPWSVTIQNHYGEISGTKGKDGEPLDVFFGPDPENESLSVFVVDRTDRDGNFDEHKVLLGFGSSEEAEQAYIANYSQGEDGGHSITGLTMEQFKSWVAGGKHDEAFSMELSDVTPTDIITGAEPVTPPTVGPTGVTEPVVEDTTVPPVVEPVAPPVATGTLSEIEADVSAYVSAQVQKGDVYARSLSEMSKRYGSDTVKAMQKSGFLKVSFEDIVDENGFDISTPVVSVNPDYAPAPEVDTKTEKPVAGPKEKPAKEPVADTVEEPVAEEPPAEEPKKTLADEINELSVDELMAEFDATGPAGGAVSGPTGGKKRGRPAKELPPKAKELKEKAAQKENEKAAANYLAEAGIDAGKAFSEAMKGLAALFGAKGDGSTLASFPGGLNEETWKVAKKHFDAAYEAILSAGGNLKNFMTAIRLNFPGDYTRDLLNLWLRDFKGEDISDAFTDNKPQEPTNEATEEESDADNGDVDGDGDGASSGPSAPKGDNETETPADEQPADVEEETEPKVIPEPEPEPEPSYLFPDPVVAALYPVMKANGRLTGTDFPETHRKASGAQARANLIGVLTNSEPPHPSKAQLQFLIKQVEDYLDKNTDAKKKDPGTVEDTEAGAGLIGRGKKSEDTKEGGIAGLRKDLYDTIKSKAKNKWETAISKASKTAHLTLKFNSDMTPGTYRAIERIRDNIASPSDYIDRIYRLKFRFSKRGNVKLSTAIEAGILAGESRIKRHEAAGEKIPDNFDFPTEDSIIKHLGDYVDMLKTLDRAFSEAKSVREVRHAIISLMVNAEYVEFLSIGGKVAAEQFEEIKDLGSEVPYRPETFDDGTFLRPYFTAVNAGLGRNRAEEYARGDYDAPNTATKLWKALESFIGNEHEKYLESALEGERIHTPMNQLVVRTAEEFSIPTGLDTKGTAEWLETYIKKTFGIRAVATGNWVSSTHQRLSYYLTAVSFHDIVKLIGAKNIGISIGPSKGKAKDGENVVVKDDLTLSISFGASGIKGSSAHFMPSTLNINLNRDSGDGTLAHEWAHAFDIMGDWVITEGEYTGVNIIDDLKRSLQFKFQVENAINAAKEILKQVAGGSMKRSPVEQAKELLADNWKDYAVVNTKFFRDSDSGPKSGYWSSAVEMFARAFEAYAADNLDDTNEFLVDIHQTLTDKYPSGDERSYINNLMQRLYDGVQWGKDGKPSPKDGFVPVFKQLEDEAQAILDDFLKKIDEIYQAMHQGEPSADGLYWYAYKVASRGFGTQPKGYWGYDDKHDAGLGGTGAVGYAQALHADDVIGYSLKPITHDEDANKVYLPEEEKDGQESTTAGPEGVDSVAKPPSTNGKGATNGPRSGGSDGDGSGDGNGGGRGNDEDGDKPGRSDVDSDGEVDTPTAGDGENDTDGRTIPVRSDFILQPEHAATGRDAAKRFSDNLSAIRALNSIRAKGGEFTEQERVALAGFTGWAGLDEVFSHKSTYNRADNPWAQREDLLRKLLSKEEFDEASLSSNNASFIPTPVETAGAVWSALSHFGMNSGNAFIPGSGTGNIYGAMPEHLRLTVAVNGVESDKLLHEISKILYPNSGMQAGDLSTKAMPDNYFDSAVAVGDNASVTEDKINNQNGFGSSAYFIRRSAKSVRPGGMVAAVVPSGLVDGAADSASRTYAAVGLDLVGAVRLPPVMRLVAKGYNTPPSYDVLFFRKQIKGEKFSGAGWVDGKYFVNNPGNVIAEASPAEVVEAMARIVSEMPADILTKEITGADKPLHEMIKKPGEPKDGGFHVAEDGKLMHYFDGNFYPVELTGPRAAQNEIRIRNFLKLRDKIRELLMLEAVSANEKDKTKAREELKDLYFKQWRGKLGLGFINERVNYAAFFGDPDAGLVMALEKWDYVNETLDEKKPYWEIFEVDVLHSVSPPTPDTVSALAQKLGVTIAEAAMRETLNWKGTFNWKYMSEISGGIAVEELQRSLNGSFVFNDPEMGWVPASVYLSGDVRKKLAVAKSIAEANKDYEVNVAALESAQVEPIQDDLFQREILQPRHLNVGSPWIPADVIENFVHGLFDNQWWVRRFKLRFIPELGQFVTFFREDKDRRDAVSWAQNSRWSHPRNNFFTFNRREGLIDIALNGGAATGSNMSDADRREANRIALRIREEFNKHLIDNESARAKVLDAFNKTHRKFNVADFDGSYMSNPGKAVDTLITLKPHQKNGAAHALWQNVYYGHEVGVGKTYTMQAAIMEHRRLGKAKKPILACLPANIDSIYTDFMRLYPAANILRIDNATTSADKKERIFKQVKNENWDAIIVTHEALGMFDVSPVTKLAELEEEIGAVNFRMREYGGNHIVSGKLEKLSDTLTAQAKKLAEKVALSSNADLTIEALGIDMLVIDEAHAFKNLQYRSNYSKSNVNFKGLSGQDSARANNLLNVTNYLNRNGHRIIFASGTPVSNSPAELFSLQRFLQPEVMKELGIDKFDPWLHSFGQVVVEDEPTKTGDGYESVGKFKKFYFVGDMLRMAYQVLDVRKADDVGILRPKIRKNSKGDAAPEAVMVEQTSTMKRFMEWLRFRATRMKDSSNDRIERGQYRIGTKNYKDRDGKATTRGGNYTDTSYDIALKIVNDGRQAAISPKLFDPKHDSDASERTKIDESVGRILNHYYESKSIKGVQLIFADFGVPSDQNIAQGYNVYDEIIDKLVAGGIPRKEIGTIYEASGGSKESETKKKRKLFSQLNNGEKRILIGSTKKAGTGVNVQKRVVAMHHIDIDWNFSSYEQRNGRGLRQGNIMEYVYVDENGKWVEVDPETATPEELAYARENALGVAIYNYGTMKTVDQFMWSTVARKGVFVDQIMSRRLDLLTLDDFSDETESANEMVASLSGDPLEEQRVTLMAKMIALKGERQNFEGRQAEARREAFNIPERIHSIEKENREIDKVSDILEKATHIKMRLTDKLLKAEQEKLDKDKKNPGRQAEKEVILNLEKDAKRIREITEAMVLQIDNRASLVRSGVFGGHPNGVLGFTDEKGVFEPIDAGVVVKMNRNFTIKEVSDGVPDKDVIEAAAYFFKVRFQTTNTYSISNGVRGSIGYLLRSGKTVTEKNIATIEELEGKLKYVDEMKNMKFEGAEELIKTETDYDEVMDKLTSRPGLIVSDTDEFSYIRSYDERLGVTWSDVEPPGSGGAYRVRYTREGVAYEKLTKAQAEAAKADEAAKAAAAENNDLKFSRNEDDAGELINAITGQQANEAVAELRKKWAGMPNTVIVEDPSQLPGYIQARIRKAALAGATGRIRGVYDAKSETVFLVSGNADSVADLKATIVHEVLRHFGLHKTLGADIKQVLNQVFLAKKEQAKAIAERYGIDLNSQAGRLEAAEEVLAHIAETGSDAGILDRAIAAIRSWLRKIFDLKMSDTEIKVIISNASRLVREGLMPNGSHAYAGARFAIGESDRKKRIRDEMVRTVKELDRQGQPVRGPIELSLMPGLPPGLEGVNNGPTREDMELGQSSPVIDAPGRAAVRFVVDQTRHLFSQFSRLEADGNPAGDARKRLIFAVKNLVSLHHAVAASTALDLESLGHDVRGEDGNIDGLKFIKALHSEDDSPSGGVRLLIGKNRNDGGTEAQRSIRERTIGKSRSNMTLHEKFTEIIERVKSINWLGLRAGFINDLAVIEDYEKNRHGGTVDASLSASKKAALSRNIESVMAAVMMRGPLVMRNGWFELENPESGKGFIELFEPLVKYKDPATGETVDLLELWEGWAAAQRAERLLAEGRENNFTAADIAELKNVPAKYEALFQKVFDEYQTFNKKTLDLATAAGVINAEERKQWEQRDYLPFYRVFESFDGVLSPGAKKGLADQTAGIRKLRGGEGKIGPVVENMLLNMTHLIDASFKNVAMREIVSLTEGTAMEEVPKHWKPVPIPMAQVIKALKDAGVLPDQYEQNELEALLQEGANQRVTGYMTIEELESIPVGKIPPGLRDQWATLLTRVAPTGPDIVSVMVEGKPKYYRVTDPLLLRTVQSMRPEGTNALMKAMGWSKRFLTGAVTIDPAFMVANFIRDSFATWVVSDTNMKPLFDSTKGLIKAWKNDSAMLQIMAAGGGGGGYYHARPKDVRKHMRTELKTISEKSFADTVLDSPFKIARLWQKLGSSSESANRILLYEDTIQKGGTVAEGAFKAMDILNFTRRGNYKTVRFLTEVVPFMNARIQGLDRIGRGIVENPMSFSIRGAMLAAATIALYGMNAGEPEYEDLPEWDKDTYWHFWAGGEHFRIPKPFEVGAVFATIPERIAEGIRKERGDIFMKRFGFMMAETFSMNPTPQLIKPVFEQIANKNFFTGSPIVGMALQNLKTEAQYTPWTSETARAIGAGIPGISPKRFEELVRGYSGSIGLYTLGISDWVLRQSGAYPDRPAPGISDIPILKRFIRDDIMRNTKHFEPFFDMVQEAAELHSTIRQYRLEGRTEDANELTKENASKLRSRLSLNRARRQLTALSHKEKIISADRFMSPADKRKRIDEIQEKKNALVKRYSEKYGPIF